MQVGGKKGMHTVVMLQYFGLISEALKRVAYSLLNLLWSSLLFWNFFHISYSKEFYALYFALEVKLIQMIQQLHLDAL